LFTYCFEAPAKGHERKTLAGASGVASLYNRMAYEALKNILAFTGCTVPEAMRMVAATPARLIGEGERKGRLAPGYDADVTVLRSDLSVEAVYKGGSRVYLAG